MSSFFLPHPPPRHRILHHPSRRCHPPLPPRGLHKPARPPPPPQQQHPYPPPNLGRFHHLLLRSLPFEHPIQNPPLPRPRPLAPLRPATHHSRRAGRRHHSHPRRPARAAGRGPHRRQPRRRNGAEHRATIPGAHGGVCRL
ncbi:alpha/beta hydrolase [Histoplasma capsulatum G186AR]|nr:alpha/beta hydrolase [Histoplasma capsulatum G186AR]